MLGLSLDSRPFVLSFVLGSDRADAMAAGERTGNHDCSFVLRGTRDKGPSLPIRRASAGDTADTRMSKGIQLRRARNRKPRQKLVMSISCVRHIRQDWARPQRLRRSDGVRTLGEQRTRARGETRNTRSGSNDRALPPRVAPRLGAEPVSAIETAGETPAGLSHDSGGGPEPQPQCRRGVASRLH